MTGMCPLTSKCLLNMFFAYSLSLSLLVKFVFPPVRFGALVNIKMSTSSSCPVRKISPKRICYPKHTLAMPSAVARHPPSHHLRCASAARTRTSETSGQGWWHVPPSWGWTKGGLVHRHLSQLSGYPVEVVPSTAIAHSIPILKIFLAHPRDPEHPWS